MKKLVSTLVVGAVVMGCGISSHDPHTLTYEKRNIADYQPITNRNIADYFPFSGEHGRYSPKIVYPVSEYDFEVFMHIVACEADPQHGYEGALDVATVIMNRLASGYWGDSLYSVLSAEHNGVYQFSTFPIWKTSTPQDYEIKACEDVINGVRSLPSNVLFFCTPKSYNRTGSWFQSLTVVERRNGHVFMSK